MSDTDFVYQAVARAKQVAAKLAAGSDNVNQNNGTPSDNISYSSPPASMIAAGMKRTASESLGMAPQEKKSMGNDKLSAVAEAVSKINEKLGAPVGTYGNPLVTQTQTVVHRIPDKYVGLVIGKKGEQIIQLQTESQCKVVISQEGGTPERDLTMTGTPQQIEKAKQMITDIIERAGGSVIGVAGTIHSIDVMIPGLKAGLVIGKNGETIKHLQEATGAKMVLIQESSTPTADDKPLRITGDVESVEKAKNMVIALLANKDGKAIPRIPMPTPPENADLCVYAVPTEKAGLVIGKGGETIREICGRSGAFVEISKQQTADPAIKLFNIRGQRHEIDNAIRYISERAGIPVGPPHQYYPGGQAGANVYGQPAQAWAGYGGANATAAAATQQGWPQQAGAAAAAGAQGMPPPTINPQTGQLDYSAAWAEYYRRQGMHDYADMIVRQAQQNNPAFQASTQTAAAYGTAGAQAQQPSTQAQPTYDYSQWQQWQQWQQQGGAQAAAAANQQWMGSQPGQPQQPMTGQAVSGQHQAAAGQAYAGQAGVQNQSAPQPAAPGASHPSWSGYGGQTQSR